MDTTQLPSGWDLMNVQAHWGGLTPRFEAWCRLSAYNRAESIDAHAEGTGGTIEDAYRSAMGGLVARINAGPGVTELDAVGCADVVYHYARKPL